MNTRKPRAVARRTAVATLAALAAASAFTLLAAPARAAEPRPFTQKSFDQLAQAGKPVVVDVSATWCPTCKAQKPIIDSLAKQPAYQGVTVLTVDFDAEKPTLRHFKVAAQSTLIAFKGGKETARTVGDTTPAGIEALFKKAAD